MSVEFIKPGTRIEFMGVKSIFLGISGILILASLVAMLVFGLNLGVDFKGGTKMVLAFKGSDPIDRDLIRNAVVDTFKKLHPESEAPQVEVQDFRTGGAEEDSVRYMVYTEIVTLLTEEQKESISAAIKEKFGADTVVNPPAEGGDQFFLTFQQEAPIKARADDLAGLFGEHGLQRVVIESDKVRDLSLEFFKELNLARQEADSPERYLEEIEAEQAFAKRIADFRDKNLDMSFSVKIEELSAKMEEAVRGAAQLADRFSSVESATSISPSVGADLLNDGLLAVLYACIGILIYVALRFDFKYGPGAVVALVHDAFITVGIFALTQVPFSLPIIAAVLTIIGYSVNDTIVVFDRIRENVEKLKGLSFERIINTSVNETLSRTILTSGTTLLTVLAIFFLGGGLIKDFAFALIFGIAVGTYSSIFIASPILLAIHNATARKEKMAA